MEPDPFVRILAEEQARLGINDQAFADLFGIRREHWSRLKRNLRALGLGTVRSVFAHYRHPAGKHRSDECLACRLSDALAS